MGPQNHSDGQDDLSRGVSAATQQLSDVGEPPAIGFDADHRGAHTLVL
jgi:hypothetical protein